MIEDCRLIDTTRVPLAKVHAGAASFPTGSLSYSTAASVHGEVVAFRPRLQLPVVDGDQLQRRHSVSADQEWRRRTAGLKKLGQRKSRSLRVMWPANDRGRRPSAEINSTLPLHILTGAVVAFGAGLVMAGVGSLVAHPELLPNLTTWFG